MSLRHWLQLSLTEGIGPILSRRIIEASGGIEPACNANLALLKTVEGIGSAKASKVLSALLAAREQVDSELARAQAMNVTILCPNDEHYPLLLKQIPDPPNVLYMRGSLEPRDLNALAIVGSRRCSYYGREQAERFGASLAGAGFTVISGGARGIDSAAHRGAMQHPQGRTIAVLGSGVDVPYPSENKALFDQIAQGGRGAVLGEYPLGTSPLKENFPRRNRVVSGLSRGVLVIEADERSGALITARQACDDHGRTVFALPGRVDNAMSAGPHKLIRDGAVLVTKLEDIIEALEPLPHAATQPMLFDLTVDSTETAEPSRPIVIDVTLTDRQKLVLEHVGVDPASVDALVERTSLAAHEVMQDLTFLTLKSLVKRIDGHSFVRIGRSA